MPSIWLGFSATQLNTGMRNLVWIGFFTFTAGREQGSVTGGPSPQHAHRNIPAFPGPTHLNRWQWGGHLAQHGAAHRAVGVVVAVAQGPPGPQGAVGVVGVPGHLAVEGLGGA